MTGLARRDETYSIGLKDLRTEAHVDQGHPYFPLAYVGRLDRYDETWLVLCPWRWGPGTEQYLGTVVHRNEVFIRWADIQTLMTDPDVDPQTLYRRGEEP